MKKQLITSVLFLSLLLNLFAQNDTWLLDSIICDQFNNSNQPFPKSREIYQSYDTQGRLLVRERENFINNTWLPEQRLANLWDTEGNLSTQTFFSWNIGSRAWYYDLRHSYQYHTEGVLKYFLKEKYNQDFATWEKVSQDVYTFSDFEGPDTYEIDVWNAAANQWRKKDLVTFTYLPDGLTGASVYQKWDTLSNSWINSQRTTYTYLPDGKRNEIIRESWSNGNWVNSSKSIYAYYPSGAVRELLTQTWNAVANNWTKNTQVLYEYDSEGRETLFFYGVWNGLNYANYLRVIQMYDQNGNLETRLDENWINGRWVSEELCTYFYRQFISSLHEAENTFLCNFPNPLPKAIPLVCPELANSGVNEIRLFDMSGKLLQNIRMPSSISFVLEDNIQPGLYVLAFFKNGKTAGAKKVIVGF